MSTQVKPGNVPVKANERPKYAPQQRGGGPMGHGVGTGEKAASFGPSLRRLLGRLPDAAYLCFLRPGEAIRIGLDAESLPEAAGLVTSLKLAQEKMDFPTREGAACLSCPFYQGLCPAGRGRVA